ncbi:hypothetical protein VTO73DRAFT_8242 [Trametes versicolor]
MAPPKWRAMTRCVCISFGCSKTKRGWDSVTKQTAYMHRQKDEEQAQAAETASGFARPPDHFSLVVDPPEASAPSVSLSSGGPVPEQGAYIDTHDGSRALGDDTLYSEDEPEPMITENAEHTEEPARGSPRPPSPAELPSGHAEEDPRQEPVGEGLPPRPALYDLTGAGSDLDSRSLAPAFEESPPVRLAYLHAVLGNVFGHATVAESQDRLNDELDLIEMCHPDGLPVLPRKPARSLATAKKRLGLDVDSYLYQQPVCTVCFRDYTQEDIDALPSPGCLTPRCKGIVYIETSKRTPSGPQDNEHGAYKRVPAKYTLTAPLLKALPRFMGRKDFMKSYDKSIKPLDRAPLGPSEHMHDIQDARAYRATLLDQKRVRLPDGTVRDEKAYAGPVRTLYCVRYGMSFTINLDWFGLTDGRPHSAGAVYLTHNNKDRAERFLQRNTHLWCLIAGPHEPSLEQMNYIMAPLKRELDVVYGGILVWAYGSPELEEAYGGVELQTSDIPASCKAKGAVSHCHDTNFCAFCLMKQDDINTPIGYACEHFKLRDDWETAANSFRAKDAPTKAALKRLVNETGKRYCIFDELPGWLPVSTSAVDFMHNFYGIAAHMFKEVLLGGYLINADGWRKVQDTINSIQWPSGIGRLPNNLGDNRGLPKADQWRRWVNIQCTVLWLAWRDGDDRLRHAAPEVPHNAKSKPTFTRNLAEIYRVFLYASIAERILASKSISEDDVKRGHRFMQMCCQEMLRLGIHLVPNYHFAMHYPQFFRLFGPVYAWWLFAHERFNGEQEKVNTNGRAAGEMELTLMRNWIAKHRLFELLSSLPPDATPQERSLLTRVCREQGAARGTLRTQISAFAQGATSILKPKRVKKFADLRKLAHTGVYCLLLDYARTLHPELNIGDFMSLERHDAILVPDACAKLLPFVVKDGLRFGSTADSRTQADIIACVDFRDARIPCRMLYHFELQIADKPPVLCSVVERLTADGDIPSFPWGLYSTDLGIYTAYANTFQPMEIIATSQLAAVTAIIPVTSRRLGPDRPLWVVHSFDRTGIEPEDTWFDSLEQELDEDD